MKPIVVKSARDLVAERLREEIYVGNLKPGQELVQDRISEELGVSRMPVREALLLLESAGLIEICKNKRAIVKQITPEGVKEHLEIRAILEGHAAIKACRKAPDFIQLHQIMDEFRDEAVEDVSHFRTLNTQFHFTIWNLADSPRLQQMLEQLWFAMPSAYPLNPIENFRRNKEQHTKILAALDARDEDAVYQAVTTHIAKTEDLILARLNQIS